MLIEELKHTRTQTFPCVRMPRTDFIEVSSNESMVCFRAVEMSETYGVNDATVALSPEQAKTLRDQLTIIIGDEN